LISTITFFISKIEFFPFKKKLPFKTNFRYQELTSY